MQITNSGSDIKLHRYGGATGDGPERKSLSVRVGSFPSGVQPEFQLSATETDPEKIPFSIYRETTPNEHDQIIEFVRQLRADEARDKIKALTDDLRSITRMLKTTALDSAEVDALASACAILTRALRKPKAKRSPTNEPTALRNGPRADSRSSPAEPESGEAPPPHGLN